ncbi:MAG: hypothetical protein ACQER0_08770 [Bacillota bacterium]
MNYSKVDKSFWHDSKVENWQQQTKFFALYLLTNQHNNSEGFYKLPLAYISFDLNLKTEKVKKMLQQLENDDFISYDYQDSIILITKGLKYNCSKNKNQRQSAYNKITNLRQSSLFPEFIKQAELYDSKFAKFLKERS